MKRVTIVGAGVMGKGIAYVAAVGGFQVTLVDQTNSILEEANAEIDTLFQKGVTKGKLTEEDRQFATSRIDYETSLEVAVQRADLVIEAVPEVMSLKKSVFEALDRFAPDHCLFASNTSTMSPTEIGSYTNRPDKVMAMHFFNPVPRMPLVELVRGLETSEMTVGLIEQAAKDMGKETVVVQEFPGFVTSRISAMVGNEAFYMLQEGVGTPEEIDKALKLGLNFPMGPFELGDLVGLDTRLNNLNYLHETLGEKFRPCPLLVKYVKAGRLGRKTGRGVYDYSQKGATT